MDEEGISAAVSPPCPVVGEEKEIESNPITPSPPPSSDGKFDDSNSDTSIPPSSSKVQPSVAACSNRKCKNSVGPSGDSKCGRERKSRDDKVCGASKKKDVKNTDSVFKDLNLSYKDTEFTTNMKLGALMQKYAVLVDEHKTLQKKSTPSLNAVFQHAAMLSDKKNTALQREKDQLQADHSKAILTRSRLESLCRELQRQNKTMKEEYAIRIREEEEKKRDVVSKFQSTLTEVGTLLMQNNDKNAKLRDDNLGMSAKLKSVCEQYERKEQHLEKLAKQMTLETQLAVTKLSKAEIEKEALAKENEHLRLELNNCQAILAETKLAEGTLRSQLEMYNEKYDEFHKALTQSGDAINGFKQEMERMSKQIRKLEKEAGLWKGRYETAHRTLLQMTEEKLKTDQSAVVANRQLAALQSLCRRLQAQCVSLRKDAGETNATEHDQTVERLTEEVGHQLAVVTNDDDGPCPRQLAANQAAAPTESEPMVAKENEEANVNGQQEKSSVGEEVEETSVPNCDTEEPLMSAAVNHSDQTSDKEVTTQQLDSSSLPKKNTKGRKKHKK